MRNWKGRITAIITVLSLLCWVMPAAAAKKAAVPSYPKYHCLMQGMYGPSAGKAVINDSVTINGPSITLQNTTITKDLIIGSGVGSGTVTLRNVTVKGKTLVSGGGPNSIMIENSTLGQVSVTDPKNRVSLHATGTSTVGAVTFKSGGSLRESNLIGTGFGSVIVASPKNVSVTLSGALDTVTVTGPNARVSIAAGGTVKRLDLKVPSAVTNAGTVTQTVVAPKVAATVNGQRVAGAGAAAMAKPKPATVSPAPSGRRITWIGAGFTESSTLQGTIPTTVVATLEGDQYTAGPFIYGVHYLAYNVPAGLSVNVTRLNESTALVILSGTAANHELANSISNLVIVFNGPAFVGGNSGAVANSVKDNLSVTFVGGTTVTKGISWSSSTFTESSANEGAITTSITATLTGDTFVPATFVKDTHFTVSNVPSGLTVNVARTSSTVLTVTLTGNASAHAASNNISNMGITLTNAAFTGGSSAGISNCSKTFSVSFTDGGTRSIAWSTSTFSESSANNGGISTTITGTLSGTTFKSVTFAKDTHYTVSGVPTGLTANVSRDSNTQVTISLTGTASTHSSSDSVSNLSIAFKDAAFTDGFASEISSASKTFSVNFINSGASISWSNTAFYETVPSSGAISTTISATLTGDTFTAGPFYQDIDYTVTNIPSGLRVQVTRSGSSQLSVTLTGNATNHASGSSITNMTISLDKRVFTGDNASSVSGASKTFSVIFTDPVVIFKTLTWSPTTFSEAPANDGSISTSITAALANESFVDATFAAGTHYTVSNVPVGLTAVVTRNSANQVTVTLTGNATNHALSNSVTSGASRLSVAFTDNAFTGANASAVDQATKAFSISFNDPPVRSLTWNPAVLTESTTTPGAVEGSITVSLANDTWAAAALSSTHFTATAPPGLTVVITTSGNTATITLANAATNHAAADSNVVSITFLPEAFTGGSGVTNLTGGGSITFTDPAPPTP
ncbi:MAG: beta strand repeat-containing protein [Solirubrobacterales bacterium]